MKKYIHNTYFMLLFVLVLSVAIVPTISFEIFSYYKYTKVFSEQINRKNESLIYNAGNELSKIKLQCENISKQITIDKASRYILNKTYPRSPEEISGIAGDIRSCIGSSIYIYDAGLYFSENDMVITKSKVMTSEEFFSTYTAQFYGEERSALDQLLSQIHYKKYFPGVKKDYEGEKPIIIYTQSLPENEINDVHARIFLILDMGKISRRLDMVDGIDHKTMLFFDKKQTLLFSSDETVTEIPDYVKKARISAGGMTTDKTDDEIAICSMLPKNDWSVLYLIPKDDYLRDLKNIRNIILIISFAVILTAALGAGIIIMKLYKPIDDIVAEIAGNKRYKSKNRKRIDEFNVISQEFNNIKQENETLNTAVYRQSILNKDRFFEDLIEGKKEKYIQSRLKTLDIELPYVNFLVIIMRPQRYGEFDEKADSKLACLAMINIFHEMMETMKLGLSYEIDYNGVVAVVNTDDAVLAGKLNDFFDEYMKIIDSQLGMSANIGISSMKNKIELVRVGYKEALETLNFKMSDAEKQVIFFEDLSKKTDNKYYYPIEIEAQMIKLVEKGDFESIESIVKKIMYENNKMNVNSRIRRLLHYEMLGTVMKVASYIHENESGDMFYSEFEDVIGYDAAFTEILTKKYRALCESIIKEAESHPGKDAVEQYKEYIDNNYTDCNLSVAMLAEHFEVSRQTVFAVFKKGLGLSPADYIANARIECAKELLKKTDMNNMQLAQFCGFTTDKTFVRTFKKITGITPKKYKDSL